MQESPLAYKPGTLFNKKQKSDEDLEITYSSVTGGAELHPTEPEKKNVVDLTSTPNQDTLPDLDANLKTERSKLKKPEPKQAVKKGTNVKTTAKTPTPILKPITLEETPRSARKELDYVEDIHTRVARLESLLSSILEDRAKQLLEDKELKQDFKLQYDRIIVVLEKCVWDREIMVKTQKKGEENTKLLIQGDLFSQLFSQLFQNKKSL